MTRGLALTATFVILGAVPALAQTHAGSHAERYPHGPGHVRLDSATHAMMHAQLHGSWAGTLSSHRGFSSSVDMSIKYDSLLNPTLMLRSERPGLSGAATDLVMNGDQLHWTQQMSGASCIATAVLTKAASPASNTIEGKMLCKEDELTFSLRKKTG